jgi:hypothetical protein
MSDHDRLPSIAEAQRTPLVEQLLEQIEQVLEENHRQAERIQQLRDEIARLKGQKGLTVEKDVGFAFGGGVSRGDRGCESVDLHVYTPAVPQTSRSSLSGKRSAVRSTPLRPLMSVTSHK